MPSIKQKRRQLSTQEYNTQKRQKLIDGKKLVMSIENLPRIDKENSLVDVPMCTKCNWSRKGYSKSTSRSGYIGRSGDYCGHRFSLHVHIGCQCKFHEALANSEISHPDVSDCLKCKGRSYLTTVHKNRYDVLIDHEFRCVNCNDRTTVLFENEI